MERNMACSINNNNKIVSLKHSRLSLQILESCRATLPSIQTLKARMIRYLKHTDCVKTEHRVSLHLISFSSLASGITNLKV